MMPSPLPSTQPSHIWTKKTHMSGMLFIDFSSAFNTIIPQQLTHKLVQLGSTLSVQWLLDFLTGRPQAVRVGINTSSNHHTEHRGPPRMCAEPPPLHSADPRLHTVHTTLTFSLSLWMTRLWWVSLATEMRQTTGAR